MASKMDIIVVGATGYTGRITAKYLSTHQEKFTWGIAGRSEAKLKDLQDSLGPSAAAAANVETFTFDIAKPETLDAICRRARCIISCAGPFNKCGMPVVEACVRNGVHYVDSTGEFTFVRLVAERFHAEAQRKRIVLVSCCGFDSVPADLGNYILHREAKAPLQSVTCYYKCKTSGLSSGTAGSIADIANYMTRQDLSPTSLNSITEKSGKSPVAAPTRLGVWYDCSVRSWTAPFLMAACNERVVRRSNALAGSSASYSECLQTGLIGAVMATASFCAMGLLMAVGPLRNFLVRRFFPMEVAHGPDAAAKAKSFFRCTFVGKTVHGATVTTTLQSSIDMYDVTGVFLGECALSAVSLAAKGKVSGGVLTPATAFGDELARRSRDAGINITTVLETKEGDKKSD